jgi:hypothetical protein
MKTLLRMAIGMIKRTKDKLSTQNTTGKPLEVKNKVMAEFDKIITYIEALHKVENHLSCVEDKLKDIKQTAKETHRPWALATPCKATAHTSQTAERETHKKSQQQQAER